MLVFGFFISKPKVLDLLFSILLMVTPADEGGMGCNTFFAFGLSRTRMSIRQFTLFCRSKPSAMIALSDTLLRVSYLSLGWQIRWLNNCPVSLTSWQWYFFVNPWFWVTCNYRMYTVGYPRKPLAVSSVEHYLLTEGEFIQAKADTLHGQYMTISGRGISKWPSCTSRVTHYVVSAEIQLRASEANL